jgi:hypothetical protein
MRAMLFMAGGAALGLLLGLSIGAIVGVGVLLAAPSAPPGEVVAPSAPPGEVVEPSQKAVKLGRSISEGMNTAAFAALLLMPAGAFAGWRRARARRAPPPS